VAAFVRENQPAQCLMRHANWKTALALPQAFCPILFRAFVLKR